MATLLWRLFEVFKAEESRARVAYKRVQGRITEGVLDGGRRKVGNVSKCVSRVSGRAECKTEKSSEKLDPD